MHNSESIVENETNKLIWDFQIQTHHLILTRRLDFVIINTSKNIFLFWRTNKVKNLRKRKERQVPRPYKRTGKKTMDQVRVIVIVT